MAKHERVVIGTEIKLKVSIDPIGDLTMDKYNFVIEVYCNPRKLVTITKEDIETKSGFGGVLDDGSYYICIDTSDVGIGNLKVKVTAYLPDSTFGGLGRTEVTIVNTGIVIINDI